MNTLTKERYMTVREVAQALGVSYRAVHRVLEMTGNLDGTVKVENGKTAITRAFKKLDVVLHRVEKTA